MDLVRLIRHPELMDRETLYDLRQTIALHPYYQTARLLMLQNLYLLHDPTFDEELRRAAIYITDRKVLFNLVEAAHYKINRGERREERLRVGEPCSGMRGERSEDSNRGEIIKEGRSNTTELIDKFLDSLPVEEEEKESKKRKPTAADAAIDYVAYLMETEGMENEEEKQGESTTMSIIDSFINQNEKGRIELKEEPEFTPEIEEEEKTDEIVSDESYFTETLARIYIKQGRYSQALEIIKRLNLAYPKKNAYFADQIRFLEKLIINNNQINK